MSENINQTFFVNGTSIFTTKGNKHIQDIKVLDEVITNSGTIKKVLEVYKSSLDQNVQSIQVFKTPIIYSTENQLFLVIKRDHKSRRLSNPEWVRADCLDENCFIKVPCKSDPPLSSLYQANYDQDLNNSFFEFLGMWYGSGKIIEKTVKNGTEYEGSISIKCPSYLIKKIVDFGSILFKTEQPSIHIFSYRNKSKVKFVSNQVLSTFKEFQKTKLPYFFYSSSNECLKHFIYGWINTSGEITLKQEITSSLVSLNFAKELYHLFRSIGLCCEIKPKKGSNIASLKFIKNNLDMSKFSKNYDDNRCFKFFRFINHSKNCLEIDGNLYLRVISTNLTFNTKSGYTLKIEDDHSYGVEGLIAKC